MARPTGSTTRPQIKDFLGKKDIEKLVNKSIEKAKEGDPIMLKFLLEQYFGKAVQPLANDGDPFKIQVIPIIQLDALHPNLGDQQDTNTEQES